MESGEPIAGQRCAKYVPNVDVYVHLAQGTEGAGIAWYLCTRAGASVTPKAVMVLLHGSGASSVLPKTPRGVIAPLFFDRVSSIAGDWNVVLIEKRGLHLGEYHKDWTKEPSREFLERNTIGGRIDDTCSVLRCLKEAQVFDGSRMVLIGSSEGCEVAAGAAAKAHGVTHVALFGAAGVVALFDAFLLPLRRKLRDGEITPEEFVASYEHLRDVFRDIRRSPQSVEEFFDDMTYRYWTSSDEHTLLRSLTMVEAPTYIAIASDDNNALPESSDLLVAELDRLGKTNVSVRHYFGLDHGFSKPNECGGYSRPPEVWEDLLEWIERH